MAHMHDFYEALLPLLPPLRIPLRDEGDAPVVLYTDASFHRRLSDGSPVSHLGYQLIDRMETLADGSACVAHRGMAMPSWALAGAACPPHPLNRGDFGRPKAPCKAPEST